LPVALRTFQQLETCTLIRSHDGHRRKQATHSLETVQSAVSKLWFLWSRYFKFKLIDVDLKALNCSKKVHLAAETNF
jgi:hypothetical protein